MDNHKNGMVSMAGRSGGGGVSLGQRRYRDRLRGRTRVKMGHIFPDYLSVRRGLDIKWIILI